MGSKRIQVCIWKRKIIANFYTTFFSEEWKNIIVKSLIILVASSILLALFYITSIGNDHAIMINEEYIFVHLCILHFSVLLTSLCTLELTLFTFACSNLTFKSSLSRTAKHSDIMMHSEQLSKFPKKCIILRSWTIFEKKFPSEGTY